MPATTTIPSVVILIEGSFIAFADNGEILETVEVTPDGRPDWTHASICDHRGVGGAAGYAELVTALNCAEGNARLMDIEIVRVPFDQEVG